MIASTFNRQSSGDDDRTAILIFGASARAAAQSAARAGLKPYAADLFGDVDLEETADNFPLAEYPHDFVSVAQRAPASPWMYTGGLENHPELVDRISLSRPLWGNPADVLQRVRDPFELYDLLKSADRSAAETRSSENQPPADGNWLLKPISGAGGSGIALWDESAADHQTLLAPHYFQQRLAGTPISALFLATSDSVHYIGTTRQFVGTQSLSAGEFSYCGSLGPCRLAATQSVEIERIGKLLADAFRLRGLFGVDMIWSRAVPVPVEVNPRYVASVEVFERALGIPLLAWHRQSCESFDRNPQTASFDQSLVTERLCRQRDPRLIAGKAVLFARHDFRWPTAAALRTELSQQGSELVDIPQPETFITTGRPICTVLARGIDEHHTLRSLARSIQRVKRFISANRCS